MAGLIAPASSCFIILLLDLFDLLILLLFLSVTIVFRGFIITRRCRPRRGLQLSIGYPDNREHRRTLSGPENT